MRSTIEILMATYQGSQHIAEQIQSIQNQNYEDWILNISDDGSKDNTVEIINSFASKDSRIKLLPKSGPQQGVVANFSHLLESSTAPYLMFSDQDDLWLPNKIQKSFEKMQKLEKKYGKNIPLLVHTDLQVVDTQLNVLHPSFWQYAHLGCHVKPILNRVLAQNMVTGCTALINRPLAKLSNPIPNEALMHDWWIALCAVVFGQIGIVDEALMLYRQHGQNHTGAQQYGLINGIKKYWRTKSQATSNKRKRAKQASLFLERHQQLLNPQQKELFEAYQKYCLGNFFISRKAMFKHRFYKNGLLRNIHDALLG